MFNLYFRKLSLSQDYIYLQFLQIFAWSHILHLNLFIYVNSEDVSAFIFNTNPIYLY